MKEKSRRIDKKYSIARKQINQVGISRPPESRKRRRRGRRGRGGRGGGAG